MSQEKGTFNTAHFQSHLKHANLVFTAATERKTTPDAKKACFVLLDHFSMSAFSIALDTLVTLNLVHNQSIYDCKTYSLNDNKTLSDISITLTTDGNIQDIALGKDDLLVVCGGFRTVLKSEPQLNKIIRKAVQSSATVMGIWNGGFYIADSKIKDNHTVPINQDNKAIMAERFPGLHIATSSYSEEGQILTCSGPNSTLDMMLHVIKLAWGAGNAQAGAKVIGAERVSETDNDISNRFLRADSRIPDCIKESIILMESNIEDPLTIDELANLVGISRRKLERLFKSHIGVAPARYYMEYRLTRARQLIQQSNLSIFDVSIACGFVSSAHFSRTYHRYFAQSPIDTRRTTQSS